MERAIDLVRNEILRVGLDEETGIVRVSVRMADPELAARTASVLLLKLEEYLVQERSARSRLNLEFVDSRRTEAQGELAKAESRLKEFRDTNRKIMNSPDLLLDEGRLLRAMRLQEEVFLELTRQHEITKIEAQKATPILEVLDPPTRHHTPDSPKLFVLLGVGLLLGVLAGAASAAVLDGRRPNVAAAFSTMRILWSGRA